MTHENHADTGVVDHKGITHQPVAYVCSYCAQELPADQLGEAIEHAKYDHAGRTDVLARYETTILWGDDL